MVTGSTTGIGEHMARRFVAEGAKVILHGRNAERGAALVEELGADNTAFCQGDLGDATYPEQLAQDALAVHGRIDGLVNNAGLVTRNKIEETDAEFFDHIIGVNARAPATCPANSPADRRRFSRDTHSPSASSRH